MRRPAPLLNGLLAVALVAAGVEVYTTVNSSASTSASTSTTSTVKRGTVLSTVTASGNVSTPEDLSLSFQQSGTVTSILVKVGDHVTAGQVLATVDNTNQQAALTSAQAQLTAAQAKAEKTITGLTSQELAQDQASKTQSSVSVAGTQRTITEAQQSAAVDKVGYQNAVDQAQATLTTAQSQLTTDQNELQSRRDELSSAQSSYDSNASSGETSDARVRRYQRDQSSCPTTGGSSPSSTTTTTQPADGVDCGHVSYLLQVAQDVQSQEKTVAQDQTSVTQDQNSLTNAKQNQVSGLLKDQQQIATDQQQLVSGEASLNSTIAGNAVKEKPPTPDQTASDQQSIASAQQQVTSAQKNLDETSLVAPSDGTVSAVSGVVGGSSSGGSSSAASTSSTSSSSSSSSGGSGFITISQLSGLEVTASFSESDAGKLIVGQSASVTLDALPNQTLTGHIAEIAVSSTTSNNVVSYEVHVTLDHPPASVKPGMTADVAVVVQHADNVLTLPASAVSGTGSTAVVTVKGKDGKESSRTVQIGLRGDQSVEIASGLSDGDQVVVKSTSAAAGGAASGLPGGGAAPGGGLGGGGLGGGGLGGGGR